jgi:hypothetical protein
MLQKNGTYLLHNVSDFSEKISSIIDFPAIPEYSSRHCNAKSRKPKIIRPTQMILYFLE